ncbi:UNVERIFIED_CONTAM: hypothetical protein RMT77_015799 [Armadillidium vulgare]
MLTISLITYVACACNHCGFLTSNLKDNSCLFFSSLKKQEGPMSFTLQGGFTVAIAATIGVVISVYKVISVIKCLVFTTIIVISLLCLYTLQSNRDYSKLGPFLMTSLTVLLGAGIINLFFVSKIIELLISGATAILFSLFIVYDTHLIIIMKFSTDKYILAAINLYLDIINLFFELLRIFGDRRN